MSVSESISSQLDRRRSSCLHPDASRRSERPPGRPATICAPTCRRAGDQVLGRRADMGHRGERRDGEAWFLLERGVTALIPLGFKARMPVGIEAQIRPRSGRASRRACRFRMRPGTIDSDYPDEWMVIVRNPTAHAIRIEHGERIAQMVLARYETLSIELGKRGYHNDQARRIRQYWQLIGRSGQCRLLLWWLTGIQQRGISRQLLFWSRFKVAVLASRDAYD